MRQPGAAHAYRYYVLAVLTLTYACSYIDRYVLSVLVEPIKAELNVSDTQMGMLGGLSFALLYTLAGIPIARWADRGTRRSIIAAGVAVWSAMTVICGLVRSYPQLFLARVGVGLGEAACTPPAQSLIGDYFPPHQRATALSVYTMGIPVGVMGGLLFGGWLTHWFDWRVAFIVVGAPGLLLALLVRLTIREPLRGALDVGTPGGEPADTAPPLRLLLLNPTFLSIQAGGMFFALWGFGISYWAAPFFGRVHHMPLQVLASWLALGAFVGGVSGSFIAGRAADIFGRRSLRAYFLVPVAGMLVGLPATLAMLTVADRDTALALFLVQQACGSTYAAPIYALMLRTVAPRQRALAVAIQLFVTNLVGLGLGPLLIGAISDHYAASRGADEALRLALLAMCASGLVMIAIFVGAALLLSRDPQQEA